MLGIKKLLTFVIVHIVQNILIKQMFVLKNKKFESNIVKKVFVQFREKI